MVSTSSSRGPACGYSGTRRPDPRRRGRRDLIAAYLGVNVGVLAVAAALATSSVNAGLGLGLFGVLSIIRLRSEELAQHEIAYYFAALALGLIGGLSIAPTALHLALMALIVAALWVGDHSRIAKRTSRQEVLLDHAFTDGAALRSHLVELFSDRVSEVTVVKTDVVNDTTLVAVRLDDLDALDAQTASSTDQVPGDRPPTVHSCGAGRDRPGRDRSPTADRP
ncbi:MAG: DUF4956 domain-containing protein [Lapillicoccus sp.]